jgi:hypothetical protein
MSPGKRTKYSRWSRWLRWSKESERLVGEKTSGRNIIDDTGVVAWRELGGWGVKGRVGSSTVLPREHEPVGVDSEDLSFLHRVFPGLGIAKIKYKAIQDVEKKIVI